MTRYDTVVLDVDGTLLDSNYHHTVAWGRAFESVADPPPHRDGWRPAGAGGGR
jgi:beta-phosphoglucomutase-like phosphatase (HAD superfamily)